MVETSKDPVPFTNYLPCPSCNGTGKADRLGMHICLTCLGKKKLPEWDQDGRWKKKKVIK